MRHISFSYETQNLHSRSLVCSYLSLLSVSQISHSATAWLTSSDFHFSTFSGVVFWLEVKTEDNDNCFGFNITTSLDCFWHTVCFWNKIYAFLYFLFQWHDWNLFFGALFTNTYFLQFVITSKVITFHWNCTHIRNYNFWVNATILNTFYLTKCT